MINYLQKRNITFSFNTKLTTWKLINYLLNSAMKQKKEAQLAKHIIGASLQLTFPHINIDNRIYNYYDSDNANNLFDYIVGDTAFNVTNAPLSFDYGKCKKIHDNGLRAYLLVPNRFINSARFNAEAIIARKISVRSIESFVSQNLEELSNFSKDRLGDGFYKLIKTYNERVDAVEIDKSMLIEIPRNLAQYADQE
jgi:hypothetical protein